MTPDKTKAGTDMVKRAGDAVRTPLLQRQDDWVPMLPPGVRAESLLNSFAMAVNTNPALAKCTRSSLIETFLGAAKLGLDASGMLGSAYPVPYGTECKLIIGYRGLVDLCRRSGQIESIYAVAVHENDEFALEQGTANRIVHRPMLDGERGPFKLAYAVAKLKGGEIQTDWMSKADIDRVRGMSKAGKNGPWVDHYVEMAKKTVLRRLVKLLPMSVEVLTEISRFDREEFAFAEAQAYREGPNTATAARAKLLGMAGKAPSVPATGQTPSSAGHVPTPAPADGWEAQRAGHAFEANPHDPEADREAYTEWANQWSAAATEEEGA